MGRVLLDAAPVLLAGLHLRRVGLQQHAPVFDEQLQFEFFRKLPQPQGIVADDLAPLSRERIEFDEAVCALHEFQAELAPLQQRLVLRNLDQRDDPLGFLAQLAVAAHERDRWT